MWSILLIGMAVPNGIVLTVSHSHTLCVSVSLISDCSLSETVSFSITTEALTVSDITVTTTKYSWEAANDWCKDQGLEMISIHSARDNAAALEACPAQYDTCWIGIRRYGDNWQWSDGTDNWPFWENWRDPLSPADTADCGQLYKQLGSNQNGEWRNKECSSTEQWTSGTAKPLCYEQGILNLVLFVEFVNAVTD